MKFGKLGVILIGMAAAAVVGCRENDMSSLSETNGEIGAKISRNTTLTTRQIPDDVMMILLVDKPIRLSERPVPTH